MATTSPSPTVAGNRIELSGRLVSEPELRTTPGGTSVLNLVVDCGEGGEALRLGVLMTGDAGRALKAQLRSGARVRVNGMLRGRKGSFVREAGTGVEVIASAIELEKEN